jgi:hypothetical protein
MNAIAKFHSDLEEYLIKKKEGSTGDDWKTKHKSPANEVND